MKSERKKKSDSDYSVVIVAYSIHKSYYAYSWTHHKMKMNLKKITYKYAQITTFSHLMCVNLCFSQAGGKLISRDRIYMKTHIFL